MAAKEFFADVPIGMRLGDQTGRSGEKAHLGKAQEGIIRGGDNIVVLAWEYGDVESVDVRELVLEYTHEVAAYTTASPAAERVRDEETATSACPYSRHTPEIRLR